MYKVVFSMQIDNNVNSPIHIRKSAAKLPFTQNMVQADLQSRLRTKADEIPNVTPDYM